MPKVLQILKISSNLHFLQPHEPGMPFDFQYAVNDIDTTNQNVDFQHNSNSDGDVTRGEYKV